MVGPRKEVSSSSRPMQCATDEQSKLADLRNSLAAIAKEVASIAERRAKGAREAAMSAAEAGTDELRSDIRRQPVIAMVVAAAAGAAVALAFVPRSSARSSRWDRSMPTTTRADLYDIAENLQRSLSRAAGAAAAPVTPALERMVDTLSRADASSINSIIEKVSGWFQKAQEKAKQKIG